jgi:hypothetical protein
MSLMNNSNEVHAEQKRTGMLLLGQLAGSVTVQSDFLIKLLAG